MIPELQIDQHLAEIDMDNKPNVAERKAPTTDHVDVVEITERIYQLQHAAMYWEARYHELKRLYETLQRRNQLLQMNITPEF